MPAPFHRSPLLWRASALLLSAVLLGCEVSTGGGGSGPGANDPVVVQFQLGSTATLGAEGLADALVVDLDKDGQAEWIQAVGSSGLVRIAWGAGLSANGGSGPLQTLQPSGTPLRLASGDFDGDGLLGLVVLSRVSGGSGDSLISVYEQSAPNTLTLRATSLLTGLAVRVATGPLAGELQPDQILVPLPDAGVLQVLALQGGSLQLQALLSFGFVGGPLDVAVLPASQLPLGTPFPALAISERGGPSGQGRVQWLRAKGAFDYEPAGVLVGGLGLGLLPRPQDIDGDGRLDLWVCDLLGGSRGLYSSRGSALGLEPAVWVPGVESSSDARLADLNRDGKRELYALEPFTLTLRRLLPEVLVPGAFGSPEALLAPLEGQRLQALETPGGSGIFTAGGQLAEWVYGGLPSGAQGAVPAPDCPESARGYPAGKRPVLLELAHLDGDSLLDALVLDPGGNQLLMLKGEAGAAFSPAGAIPLGTPEDSVPGGFRVGGLDGDGDLDVVIATFETNKVLVLENRGSLPLVPGPEFNLEGSPLDLSLLDLDLDGALDLAVSLPLIDSLAVFKGGGDLSFTPWAQIPLPKRPLALHSVDLNGDPRPELIVSAAEPDGSDAALLVLRATDSGLFPLELSFVQPLSGSAIEITSGDLNGDGRPDLLVTQNGLGIDQLPIFLSTPDPTAFVKVQVPIGFNPAAARLVDLDRDGHLDVAAALGKGQLAYALGDGAGQFELAPLPLRTLPNSTSALRFRDLDGDQLPELLAVSPLAPYLWVARNRSQ